MTSGPPGSLAAVVVFAALLAPPGYWLLRRCCGVAPRANDLGLALGLGFCTVLPLLWLERLLGVPVLVLPAFALAVLALRSEWSRWLAGRPDAAFVAIPVLLGALAAGVNAGDGRWDATGGSFGAVFDVTDRAFYALVSQEVVRAPPPAMQNPVFAGVPFAYSFLPALSAALLRLYGGLDALAINLHHLPVVAFVLIGLTCDSLLREWGATSLPARALTPLLLVLGGDLSFLFPPRGVMGAERAAHFLAFSSFSAESLYYNPWMLALPLILAALVTTARWLRSGGRGWLLVSAWMLAMLWLTKVFACLPLVLGAALAAALRRNRRLALLALLSGLFIVPWVLVIFASGAGAGSPLVLSPFRPVRVALEVHPAWHGLGAAAFEGRGLVRWLALLAATGLLLAGGLAARWLGAAVLVRRLRHDGEGTWTWLVCACAVALVLGLAVEGHPVPMDGVQFLILPQLLLWLPTGLLLAGWIETGGPRRWGACAVVLVACAGPVAYALRKTMPHRLASAGSIDQLRVVLSSDHTAAARWLARHRGDRADVAMDPRPSRSDPAARRPLYLAALADCRLLAYVEALSVPLAVAEERRRLLREVYETADAGRAVAILDGLGADWLWVEDSRPLRYETPRLRLRATSGPVSVYEVAPR